jgi:hypothetical protein
LESIFILFLFNFCSTFFCFNISVLFNFFSVLTFASQLLPTRHVSSQAKMQRSNFISAITNKMANLGVGVSTVQTWFLKLSRYPC